MENGHLNVRVHQNEGIPEDILRKIAAEFPGPWGAAFMKDGIMEIHGAEAPDYDAIQNLLTETLDSHVFFGFSKKDAPQPPYDIIVAEATSTDTTGKAEDITIPVVVAFFAGDFHGKSEDEVGQYLAKKLQKVYAHNGEDIDKFCAEVREEDTTMEIMDRVGRGAIELFCENGEVISFAKGLTPGSFSWGYMSDNLGFGVEQKKEEKVEQPSASQTKRVVRRSVPQVASTTPISQKTVVPGDAHTKGKVHDAATQIEKLVRWAPNPKWGANKLKDKYKQLGFKLEEVPGYESGEVQVYVELKRIMSLRNQIGGDLYEEVPADAVRGPVPAEHVRDGKKTMLKDTSPDNVQTQKTLPSQQVTAAVLPVISPNEREKLLNDPTVKTLDKNSAEIEDPEKWLTTKDKHSSLIEQLGLKSDALMRLKFDGLVKFAERHGPKPLAILMVDARIKAAEQENLVKQLTDRVHELEQKLHVTAVETLKTEPQKATGTDGAGAPATQTRRVVRR